MSQELISIICQGALVAIRRSDFRVNGTHILKKAGIKRNAKWLLRKLHIEYQSVRNGPQRLQDMYVDIIDGLKLCELHGLRELHRHLTIWQIMGFDKTAKETPANDQASKQERSPAGVNRVMAAASRVGLNPDRKHQDTSEAVNLAFKSISAGGEPSHCFITPSRFSGEKSVDNGGAMGITASCKENINEIPNQRVNYNDWNDKIKGNRD